ncbi:hypothetical protein [Streptomyces tauricus]|uniref:hypothetical protein n=1 Tax=Streptomyces tauricus TaxID=68274 RepID=UPI002AD27700|nr:hypothetical protein [Streptomyces tauricus]
MGDVSVDAVRSFLATVRVGDLRSGTVAGVARSGISVILDGFPGVPLGVVGPLDGPWARRSAESVEVGQRITAEVIAVDLDEGKVRLSTAATEDRELWKFLKGLRLGEILTGTVAAIESFGVFVVLDDGPRHPVLPGVGFITVPELYWRRFEEASEIVADSMCRASSCSSTRGTEKCGCPCGRRSRILSPRSPTAPRWGRP